MEHSQWKLRPESCGVFHHLTDVNQLMMEKLAIQEGSRRISAKQNPAVIEQFCCEWTTSKCAAFNNFANRCDRGTFVKRCQQIVQAKFRSEGTRTHFRAISGFDGIVSHTRRRRVQSFRSESTPWGNK